MSTSDETLPTAHSQLRPRKIRSKTGCSVCRLRKKKCNEEKPFCSSCRRLGLLCSWPDPKEFAWRIKMGLPSEREQCGSKTLASPVRECSTEAPSRSSRSPARTISRVPFAIGLFPTNDSASLELLQLYVEQTTSYILSTPASFRDPFIYDVIPRAFEDPLIMDATLSLGGVPTSEVGSATALEAKRVFHYGRAVREMRFALTKWSQGSVQDSVRLLIITTLLCQYEVCFSLTIHFMRTASHEKFNRSIF